MRRPSIADPETLDAEYQTSTNLAARASLHMRYGRGGWFPWLAGRIA